MSRYTLILGLVLTSNGLASAQTTQGPVDGPALFKMLQDLALKPAQPDKNTEAYRLIVTRNRFRSIVQVALTPDRKAIVLTSWSAKIEMSEDETLTAVIRLLEKNKDIAPARFDYSSASKTVFLSLPVANQGIDTHRLQEVVTGFTLLVEQTCPRWKVAR